MSQEPMEPKNIPEEEKLSGTIVGGLQNAAAALGGLSTTFASVGVIGLVLGLTLLIFVSDLRTYGYIILIIAAVLILASLTISFRTVGAALRGRRGRYSTNTIVMIVALLGIAAVVAFLAFENTYRADVTSTKQFSLFPRTEEILKALNEPVEARVFFVPGRNPEESAFLELVRGQIDDIMHEFDVRTGKFSYEFVDPVESPDTAQEFGATPPFPTIVFRGKESEKTHQISPTRFLEQDFVTALLIVTGEKQKKVYFITGHDERRIENFEPASDGYGFAYDAIRSENYAVSTLNLNLPGDQEILERDRDNNDVNMLIVAGPRKDMLQGESEILDDYMLNGGNVLFLLDPETPPSFREFLARWGLVVGQGHILDAQSLGDNNEITFLRRGQYAESIPDEFLNNVLQVFKVSNGLDTTYFPGLTSLEPVDHESVVFFPPIIKLEEEAPEATTADDIVPTIFGSALAFTSGQSWLVNDLERSEPNQGDRRDIFFPAVAIRALARVGEPLPTDLAEVTPASIVVFGDSDFATNGWLFTPDNSDLFLNSINWLVGDLALIGIKPKPNPFRELRLLPNERNVMRYSSWFLLPALMALLGGVVWWKRR